MLAVGGHCLTTSGTEPQGGVTSADQSLQSSSSRVQGNRLPPSAHVGFEGLCSPLPPAEPGNTASRNFLNSCCCLLGRCACGHHQANNQRQTSAKVVVGPWFLAACPLHPAYWRHPRCQCEERLRGCVLATKLGCAPFVCAHCCHTDVQSTQGPRLSPGLRCACM